jgi:hypothetical protein
VQIQRGEQQSNQLRRREESASRTALPQAPNTNTIFHRNSPPAIGGGGRLSAVAAGKKRAHDLIRTESDSEVSRSPVSSGRSSIESEDEAAVGASKKGFQSVGQSSRLERDEGTRALNNERRRVLSTKPSIRPRFSTPSEELERPRDFPRPRDVDALHQHMGYEEPPAKFAQFDAGRATPHTLEVTQVAVSRNVQVFGHTGWVSDKYFQRKAGKHPELRSKEVLDQVQVLGTRRTSDAVQAYVYCNTHQASGGHGRAVRDVVMIDRRNGLMVAFTERREIKTARCMDPEEARLYLLREINRDRSRI